VHGGGVGIVGEGRVGIVQDGRVNIKQGKLCKWGMYFDARSFWLCFKCATRVLMKHMYPAQ
jgi:hypothetical protein